MTGSVDRGPADWPRVAGAPGGPDLAAAWSGCCAVQASPGPARHHLSLFLAGVSSGSCSLVLGWGLREVTGDGSEAVSGVSQGVVWE